MELKEQLYVCTLASSPNLMTAAHTLGISSSALSLYITNLERRLGVTLFDRSKKQFTLTEAGALYVQTAQQMLTMQERFAQKLKQFKNPRPCIRVGIHGYRANFVSARFLVEFYYQHPEIDIELTECGYQEGEMLLLNGELDLFFGNVPIYHSSLTYDIIFQKPYLLMVHPSLSQKLNPVPVNYSKYPWVDIHALQQERMVVHTSDKSSGRIAQIICDDNHFKPDNIMYIEKTDTIISLIQYGYGFSFLPEDFPSYHADPHPIHFFNVGSTVHTVPFCAIYSKKTELTPPMQDMIAIMTDLAADSSSHLSR